MLKFLKVATIPTLIILILISIYFLFGQDLALFNPAGPVALQQRNLILLAFILAAAIVIPIFTLTIFIAVKFREGNNSADYSPDWGLGPKLQMVWWILPAIIIFFLAIVNFSNTQKLDPQKSLDSKTEPIKIQVVALRWKWLFLYPEQKIASVNFVEFPAKTPIKFELTADAPMSSFWIPRLGGQIYAMTGMTTHLNLMADKVGEFSGSAAEINGSGFSGMKFTAKATTERDFESWVKTTQSNFAELDLNGYNKLAAPSENHKVSLYSYPDTNLYNKVMMKFNPTDSDHSHLMESY